MKLAYTIIYVANVPDIVALYETAFGMTCRIMHECNQHAEMETGGTALAFAHESITESNGFAIARNRAANPAAWIEVAFVGGDIAADFAKAAAAGATTVAAPEAKPWGQDVSYVRDPNSVLVEICSEMSG